jgi:hypothetical protein
VSGGRFFLAYASGLPRRCFKDCLPSSLAAVHASTGGVVGPKDVLVYVPRGGCALGSMYVRRIVLPGRISIMQRWLALAQPYASYLRI